MACFFLKCDCSVCSKQDRERFNAFKRAFRIANLYMARTGGDKYYKTVRDAFHSRITGNTIDRFLKPTNSSQDPPSHDPLSYIRYTAKIHRDRYYKAMKPCVQQIRLKSAR